MPTNFSYMQAIGDGFPNVQCTCIGNPNVYENIVSTGGDPIPSQATLDAYILSAERERQWRLIQAERDRRRASGVLVNGKWFHSDDTSRIQHLGLLMMGANMPTGIMWKTMDGTFVEMTPTLAQQIFSAVGSKDIQIFSIAEQHRAQMNASATPGTYNCLTTAPAWPTVYGE